MERKVDKVLNKEQHALANKTRTTDSNFIPLVAVESGQAEKPKKSECERCETVPAALPTSGTLFIAPPLAHTQTTIRTYLRKADIEYNEPFPSILAIPLSGDKLHRLSLELTGTLSASELQDSKSLIVGEGVVPSLFELMQMQPLNILMGRVEGEWLLDMLRENRLVSHFQPIVSSANPSSVFAYECLLRGNEADGTIVYPNRIFGVATNADLLFQLDRAARITAVKSAARHNIRTKIFINFNPSSIYDPAYCLRTTLSAVQKAGISPEQIVFEVVESSEAHDVNHLVNIMSYYRDKGFGVALDDLGAGYSSLNLLTRLKPDYVKMDVQLIRDVDTDVYKAHIASKLLEMAQQLGIRTVAEGVETEAEWHWVREHGADYVQGYLFARPASPPPTPVEVRD